MTNPTIQEGWYGVCMDAPPVWLGPTTWSKAHATAEARALGLSRVFRRYARGRPVSLPDRREVNVSLAGADFERAQACAQHRGVTLTAYLRDAILRQMGDEWTDEEEPVPEPAVEDEP
jgi:hypothetical protein